MPQSLSILLQRIAPMRWLTRSAGQFASCRHAWIAQPLIRAYVKWYGIDLQEAQHSDPRAYESFNAFFTRALRPGARVMADWDWISPADGAISQFGRMRGGQLIQAKQRQYSAAALLADDDLARRIGEGWFTTIYLSPRDYHRVHMPCDGRLLGMRYVPGTLYSVRPEIVQGVHGLLARNERLVCWFEHPQHGLYAMVLVGAAIVGSIATVWHGQVAPRNPGVVQWDYLDGAPASAPPVLRQGAQMGHFQLGSTVVLLMPGKSWQFHPNWAPGRSVRLGQAMAARS